jgi:penicillin-binding protein 1A
VLGIVSGVLFAYTGDLPGISALDDYAPSTITRVYARDGRVVGEFAIQRRMVVGYDDVAPRLREAIISAEDGGFNRHFGLSISRIAVASLRDVGQAVRDALKGRRSRPGGASTLTQQLARNLFPEEIGFQVSLERKIKEAVVALQIEKRYTKREIFVLYCNHIHFGHGTYGVEAASRLYFGKSARDLSLEEAALIAGIIQTPARQSPFVDPARALQRRNYVLQRMAEEGYISWAQADTARGRPIEVHGQPSQPASIAPFFVEEVRKHLERKYGAKALYENGLSVHTTLDADLQQAANIALDHGLRALDRRRGFRRPRRNVIAEGHATGTFKHERWGRPVGVDDIVPAVVVAVNGAPGCASARTGPTSGATRSPGHAGKRQPRSSSRAM